MSCCGETANGNKEDESNRVTPFIANAPVTQQPAPHPGLSYQVQEKTGFNQPAVNSPLAAHIPDHGQSAPVEPWRGQSSSSPLATQFHSYAAGINIPSPPPAAVDNGTGELSTNGTTHSYSSMTDRSLLQISSMQQYQTSDTFSSPGPLIPPRSPPPDEGKMSISIDFGTTYSGVAYGSSRIDSGRVQQLLHWPGSFETFRKIPTCLLYDDHGRVLAWGLEAKNTGPMPGTTRCEWFKLFLEPHALRDEGAIDPRLPQLPLGKTALDLITDFLSCLWEYCRDQITRECGAVSDLNTADVWLTVPAAWDARGCNLMRDAAISAGLVRSAHASDREWRERLRIITEPEAAAVHCANLGDLHRLKPSQNFLVCDCGGGTVDLAIYKLIGQMAHLQIAEMCARSGANCGSLFLDLRFRELVKTLLADHPVHLDAASLATFQNSFSEVDKLEYKGQIDDNKMFHFTCFNVEDPHDPSVGLINGELAIPGNLLRREVFDPVVNQVLELIEQQLKKVDQGIGALLLVGGFAGSDYLYHRVEEQFSPRIQVIARPTNSDTATVRGAAQYGLARRPLVSSVIAPRSYLMKVKLPATEEDFMKRPAYINTNNAGVSICENRLQYLVQKNAILRKGQQIRTKFCKFSQSSQDCVFVAVLYTSDTDRIFRYTDEGETTELCKWTVDLRSLPVFQQNANSSSIGGFYTEFELGLELDSAEVRGVLLYEGGEWGRVVFDFLN